MDTDRRKFLFGEGITADDWDLDSEANRSLLLERSCGGELGGLQLALREVVANQVVADDPPEVWATAQRLLADGLDRGEVFSQLVLALGPALRALLQHEQPFDREAYAVALGRLPLPSAASIEDAIVEAVRAEQGIRADELKDRVLERLGHEPDEEIVDDLFGHVPLPALHPARAADLAASTPGVRAARRAARGRATGRRRAGPSAATRGRARASGSAALRRRLPLDRRVPKAELHLHLEGPIPPSTLRRLAAERGVDLPASPAPGSAFDYRGFAKFAADLARAGELLREPSHVTDAALDVLAREVDAGCRHVEVMVTLGFHVDRGWDPFDFLCALDAAFGAARDRWDLDGGVIVEFDRAAGGAIGSS